MLWGSALQGLGTRPGRNKDTLSLSAAEILWVRALQGYVAMGTAGILDGWALQEYSVAGHCRDTVVCGWALRGTVLLLGTAGIYALQLGTAGILYSAIGHCRDTWWLGTAGIRCHGHCRDTWWLGTAGIRCH